MMNYHHPIYSQRDPRWATKRLGRSNAARNSTIGLYGCGVTVLAQYLTLKGVAMTPDHIQEILLLGGGFRQGGSNNWINWPVIPRLFPQFVYQGRADYPTSLVSLTVMNGIDDRLLAGRPVILYVDASPLAGLQQHFVLAVGHESPGVISVLNPWNGRQQNLRSYGSNDRIAICGVIWLDWVSDRDNDMQIARRRLKDDNTV